MPSSGLTVTASALKDATVREAMKNAPWAMLTCTTGGHSKFWGIRSASRFIETWWGRIGTEGQRKVKEFPSAFQAIRDRESLLRSKLDKGYVWESKPDPKFPSVSALKWGALAKPSADDWYALTPEERFQLVQQRGVRYCEDLIEKSRKLRGITSAEPPAYECDWSAMAPAENVAFVRRFGTQAAKDCAARSMVAAAHPNAAQPAKRLPLLVLPAGRFVQTLPMNSEANPEVAAPSKRRQRPKPADRASGGAAVALGRFFSLGRRGDDEEDE